MSAYFLNVLTHIFKRIVSNASVVRENIMPVLKNSVKTYYYGTGSYVRVE